MDAMKQLEQLEKRETTDLTYLEACVLGAGQRKSTRNGAARAAAQLAAYEAAITAAREAKDALEPHHTISNNGTGIMAAYNILAAALAALEETK